jgi:hypothetical protein
MPGADSAYERGASWGAAYASAKHESFLGTPKRVSSDSFSNVLSGTFCWERSNPFLP